MSWIMVGVIFCVKDPVQLLFLLALFACVWSVGEPTSGGKGQNAELWRRRNLPNFVAIDGLFFFAQVVKLCAAYGPGANIPQNWSTTAI